MKTKNKKKQNTKMNKKQKAKNKNEKQRTKMAWIVINGNNKVVAIVYQVHVLMFNVFLRSSIV